MLTTTLLVISVKADMGPKPITTIEIIGFDEPYYFDLLYKRYQEIYVLNETEIQSQIEYDYYLDYYPEELNGYIDDEGFHSYTLYTGRPHNISQVESNKFTAGYFSPPDVFKIVLVLESGEVISSEVVNKTLFEANFVFDLSNFSLDDATPKIVDGLEIYELEDSVSEIIPTKGIVLQLIVTALTTILLELGILILFRYRSWNSYKIVIIVNAITQILLYASMVMGYLAGSFFGYIGVLIIGELIVFALEIIIYQKLLKERSKSLALFYTLTANLVSLVIGLVVMSWLMI
jgi:hypothetical protein